MSTINTNPGIPPLSQAHPQPAVASNRQPVSADPASMSDVANRVRTLLRQDNIQSMLQNPGSPKTERDIIEIRTLLTNPDVKNALLQGPYSQTIKAALIDVGALVNEGSISKMQAESERSAAAQRRLDLQASLDASWFKVHCPNLDGDLDSTFTSDTTFESRMYEIEEKIRLRAHHSSSARISKTLTDIGTTLSRLSRL